MKDARQFIQTFRSQSRIVPHRLLSFRHWIQMIFCERFHLNGISKWPTSKVKYHKVTRKDVMGQRFWIHLNCDFFQLTVFLHKMNISCLFSLLFYSIYSSFPHWTTYRINATINIGRKRTHHRAVKISWTKNNLRLLGCHPQICWQPPSLLNLQWHETRDLHHSKAFLAFLMFTDDYSIDKDRWLNDQCSTEQRAPQFRCWGDNNNNNWAFASTSAVCRIVCRFLCLTEHRRSLLKAISWRNKTGSSARSRRTRSLLEQVNQMFSDRENSVSVCCWERTKGANVWNSFNCEQSLYRIGDLNAMH